MQYSTCDEHTSEMRILVERYLHTGTESPLKMSYLGCFVFLSARDIWWTKGDTIVQEEPLSTCFMDTTVHETDLCTFWTSQTFVSLKLCFLCIMHESGHSSITQQALVVFMSSVHTALNNTETMLFGVSFAFLMCIHREVECCMP